MESLILIHLSEVNFLLPRVLARIMGDPRSSELGSAILVLAVRLSVNEPPWRKFESRWLGPSDVVLEQQNVILMDEFLHYYYKI